MLRRIVYDIVGNNSFSVTNFSELDKLVIDVTLGQIMRLINEVKELWMKNMHL